MIRTFFYICCLAMMVGALGCARFQSPRSLGYRTVESSLNSDSKIAKRKYERALEFLATCNYRDAEQCLQASLLADKSFGPAHNALGKVYYDQKKFYLAAWEFEHAIKSMPTRAEPFNNLGLVLESVNQLDRAVEQYETAVEMAPQNANYLGNLLRTRIRRGDDPLMFREDFEALIFLDHRQDWVNWAKEQIVFAEAKLNRVGNNNADFDEALQGSIDGSMDGQIIDGLEMEGTVLEPDYGQFQYEAPPGALEDVDQYPAELNSELLSAPGKIIEGNSSRLNNE